MKYAVLFDDPSGGYTTYGVTDKKALAESWARSQAHLRSHIFSLTETYEEVTTKKIQIIKQGERLERHGK